MSDESVFRKITVGQGKDLILDKARNFDLDVFCENKEGVTSYDRVRGAIVATNFEASWREHETNPGVDSFGYRDLDAHDWCKDFTGNIDSSFVNFYLLPEDSRTEELVGFAVRASQDYVTRVNSLNFDDASVVELDCVESGISVSAVPLTLEESGKLLSFYDGKDNDFGLSRESSVECDFENVEDTNEFDVVTYRSTYGDYDSAQNFVTDCFYAARERGVDVVTSFILHDISHDDVEYNDFEDMINSREIADMLASAKGHMIAQENKDVSPVESVDVYDKYAEYEDEFGV